MKRILLIFMTALLLASCGQKGESSKAKFKIFSGNLTGTTQFTGGLLIFGRSSDNSQSFSVPYNDGLVLELKKGSWEFATVGWFGANPMEGTQQCDHQVVELNSDTFNVNFAMTVAKCLDSSTVDGKRFTDPRYYNNGFGGYYGFKKLQVNTCSDFVSNCSGSFQGAPSSIKVEIPSSFKGMPTPSGYANSLTSNCYTTNGTSITPPYGGENGFIGMKISTYNTNGSAGKFYYPTGIATDSLGNVYVADPNNNKVRKIDTSQIVTTLASGFLTPRGVAVYGNALFVADTGHHQIKKVSLAPIDYGTVTLVAGTGSTGAVNHASDPTQSTFNNPYGLTFDASGNMYIADNGNSMIRKINMTTGMTYTISDSLSSHGVSSPNSVAYYAGNVYFTNNTHTVKSILTNDNSIQTASLIAGISGTSGYYDNAVGTTAKFYNPRGIVSAGGGILYLADSTNNVIRKIDLASTVAVTTVAGDTLTNATGSANAANGSASTFNASKGITIDPNGKLFIADTDNHTIRKIGGVKNLV